MESGNAASTQGKLFHWRNVAEKLPWECGGAPVTQGRCSYLASMSCALLGCFHKRGVREFANIAASRRMAPFFDGRLK
jgi:hypothetical protein